MQHNCIHYRRHAKNSKTGREVDVRNGIKDHPPAENTENSYNSLYSEPDENEHPTLCTVSPSVGTDNSHIFPNHLKNCKLEAVSSEPLEIKSCPNRPLSVAAYVEPYDTIIEDAMSSSGEVNEDSDYSYAYGHFKAQGRKRQPEVQHDYYNRQEVGNGQVAKQRANNILPQRGSTGGSVVYADILHLNNEEYKAETEAKQDEDGMVLRDNELYATNNDVEAKRTTDDRDDVELVVADNDLYQRT